VLASFFRGFSLQHSDCGGLERLSDGYRIGLRLSRGRWGFRLGACAGGFGLRTGSADRIRFARRAETLSVSIPAITPPAAPAASASWRVGVGALFIAGCFGFDVRNGRNWGRHTRLFRPFLIGGFERIEPIRNGRGFLDLLAAFGAAPPPPPSSTAAGVFGRRSIAG
jgi:hypothetical protein